MPRTGWEFDSPWPHKTKLMQIPKEVTQVAEALEKGGFEAYLVGGCVRDILRGFTPKDWDVTTNARPEEIVKLFPKTFYENKFGTVTVVGEEFEVEITPYRIEGKYSDARHPDEIKFADKLEDDLARRDFTVNAMAYSVSQDKVVDLFNGQKDLKDKIIRAVGNPEERFNEDALRIMRGVRLATELGFEIEPDTAAAIPKMAPNLGIIAAERVRDELVKILMSPNAMGGIEKMHQLGILKFVIPELEEGIGMEQNGDHIYDVWTHSMKSLEHAAAREWPLHVRLGALLHDVGKPRTREWSDEKKDWTFYGHDVVGARVAREITRRLKFSNDEIDRIWKLVRYHMFFSDIDKITLSAVRRIVRNVGPELVWDLMKVRACDRIGMGRPKEQPYRLRKYESMIEEALRAPVSVAMLKINGARLMELTGEKPGPRIGWILHALLEETLDNPDLNTKEYLETEVKKLSSLDDKKLQELGEAGKEKRKEEEEKELAEIRKRYFVK